MPPEPDQRLAREIYKEMIESKSGFTTGSTTPIAEAVAARLKAAGFPAADIFVGGAIPVKANVVVRYHGTGARKPILLLAHIDVVEALRADWTVDPFTLIEKDGYFYGRGTMDDKAQAAVWIANLIRYRREGFKPDRDLIVALTADEEGGGPYNGVDWLLKNKRELIDAEYALNEGGRGEMVDGKAHPNDVSLSEKTFANFRFEVRNKGGHSARPVPDNAIYHLAGALYRLSTFAFPFRLNEVTRAYFQAMAKIEKGPLAADLARVAEGSEEAMRKVAAVIPSDERGDADHLRGDAARGRPRHQCPAPTGGGECELPRTAGRLGGGCPGGTQEGGGRRSGSGDHLGQRGPESGIAPAPRCSQGDRPHWRHHVAGRGDGADDGGGRVRRPLPARGGNPDLWRAGLLRGSRRCHAPDAWRIPVRSFYEEGRAFSLRTGEALSPARPGDLVWSHVCKY